MVDHIKPLAKGGQTVYENLEAICERCLFEKDHGEDADLEMRIVTESDPECPFCNENIKDQVVEEFGSVLAIKDRYPVSEGHHLIIPKRHSSDWFSMAEREKRDAGTLLRILRNRLTAFDTRITGFNVGFNCGSAAGQTVFHSHIHLIPRRDGDTQNPRGGVRGVIPHKMSYGIQPD